MSKEPAPELPPLNDVMVGIESVGLHPKSGRRMDVPGLKVIKPVNDRFTTTVNYQTYHYLKK